jgi:uncharacterized RDD family membrane protein YckC
MNNELAGVETEQHLFTDDDVLLQYEEASTNQRVLNFIVDSLLIRFALTYATGFVLGYLFYALSESFYNAVFFNEDKIITALINYVIGALIYVVYYTFCEKVFNGVTLGKLVTGTKAVGEDGQALTFKQTLLRSLSRVVPFEAFSAMWGAPWHDTWTNTIVVKTR